MSQRILLVACGVLKVDVDAILRESGLEVDTHYLEGGLHEDPPELRRRLQAAIDAVPDGTYRAVAVGYGICGRGSIGIRARSIPLVIPRVHDCIALFLGSDAEYSRQFAGCPGTYYVSAGWYDEKVQPHSTRPGAKGKGTARADGGKEDLAAKYGDENAQAITDFMNSWQKNYSRSVFIDTGSGRASRYESYAKAMAEEFGWTYERVEGGHLLIERVLSVAAGLADPEDDILVVPPGNITMFDPKSKKIASVSPAAAGVKEDVPIPANKAAGRTGGSPAARPAVSPTGGRKKYSFDEWKAEFPEEARDRHLGIGIDAGGTYTDAAVYSFPGRRVVAAGKAPTTKWDYTVGIGEALATVDPRFYPLVRLVAVSTTLATNAIVEGRGQPVGLLLMPSGRLEFGGHEPYTIIGGSLDIGGQELEPVDRDQVRRAADSMISRHGVAAFAVSGYGGSVNPAHELEVKRILTEHTGKYVCCGHELSGLLDFQVRANTAVLNASIIPLLEQFLEDIGTSLRASGIDATVMVVKGDGTLMSTEFARLHPVETALSGPAASVSGALFLTGIDRATVVDVGGTTSDIGTVENGKVGICADGALVGPWRTHVRAVDMVTMGLGGDSEIRYEKREFTVGPRRIVPFTWLAHKTSIEKALQYVEARAEDYMISTRQTAFVFLTGKTLPADLSGMERAVVDALGHGPCSLQELGERVGAGHWTMVPVRRLENEYVVASAGLTPTDIFHVTGEMSLWGREPSERLLAVFSRASGMRKDEFIDRFRSLVTEAIILEIIARGLGISAPVHRLLREPGASELLERMLSGGNADMKLTMKLETPLVGLGAPAGLFLETVASALGTDLVIPEHADVANAVGAVTSSVHVEKRGSIVPDSRGTFLLEGVEGDLRFGSFDEAETYLRVYLDREVKALAEAAGTMNRDVVMEVGDRVGTTADGAEVFLGRALVASVTGEPAIAEGAAASRATNAARGEKKPAR